ncbi:metalloregulator ArsR/SmtB family transcription factor [Streptosporangium sp. NPDC002544]|uniref:ArsR/SmtB family transcription factor n=1 Tax=Streptosporangium sp. NPDC002544 TaxID=3154538 RepID=UPI003318BCCD
MAGSGKHELFEAFAGVGKALASGRRLELIELLAQAERPVEDLARAAGLGLTSVSNHLQILKAAGLVATRRQGTRVFYRLAGDDVAELWALLRRVGSAHAAQVERAAAAYLGTGATGTSGEMEEVTRERLRQRLASGEVALIDVRPGPEYAAGHIPGAISIPLQELADRLAELPDGQEIVAYCRGAYCVLAYQAVHLLAGCGRRAVRLADGMLEWRLAGLPVAA